MFIDKVYILLKSFSFFFLFLLFFIFNTDHRTYTGQSIDAERDPT